MLDQVMLDWKVFQAGILSHVDYFHLSSLSSCLYSRQWRIHARGRGDASPPDFGEEGTPMYLSPQISHDDSRGHTLGKT